MLDTYYKTSYEYSCSIGKPTTSFTFLVEIIRKGISWTFVTDFNNVLPIYLKLYVILEYSNTSYCNVFFSSKSHVKKLDAFKLYLVIAKNKFQYLNFNGTFACCTHITKCPTNIAVLSVNRQQALHSLLKLLGGAYHELLLQTSTMYCQYTLSCMWY